MMARTVLVTHIKHLALAPFQKYIFTFVYRKRSVAVDNTANAPAVVSGVTFIPSCQGVKFFRRHGDIFTSKCDGIEG